MQAQRGGSGYVAMLDEPLGASMEELLAKAAGRGSEENAGGRPTNSHHQEDQSRRRRRK